MQALNRSIGRSIAAILVVLMVFNIIGFSTVEANSIAPVKEERISPDIGELKSRPPAQRTELKSKRTRYSTRYINPDGSFTEEIFLEPVFYQDPFDKSWKEIDNNLKASDKKVGKRENKANNFTALFSDESGVNEILAIEKEGKSISFIPVGARARIKGTIKNNEMLYKGIYQNTDIRYEVKGTRVKEDIILHQYSGINTFSFELSLKGYTVAEENGLILFINNKGEKEWYLEKPFMMDAHERYSDDVKLVLRKEKGKTFVDVVASKDFLENTETKYPVTIDPTINNWDIMMDSFVSSFYPTSSFGSLPNLYTGYNSGYYGAMRSFVKFFLPSLPSDAHILSANFNAYQNKEEAATAIIDLFRVTSDWNGGVTWNTQPTTGGAAEATLTATSYNEYWQWDITQLAKDWYYGAQSNYGLMLKQRNETTAPFRRFTSVESAHFTPRLSINYTVEPIGLEDFWGYTKDGVNPANGNLVLQQSDLYIPGRGIPVGITRTYNSRKNHVTAMFGNGWRSNLEAFLVDPGSGPITLVDGDSTRHIFGQKIGGGYAAAGGVYLDLVKHGNGTYTITQIDGSKINFNTAGKISTIVDMNGNTTTLTYTGGRLTAIQDASGRGTTIQYGTNGMVSKVTDPAARLINYEYDTNGNLTKVIDPENKVITMGYAYDRSLITLTDQRNIATTIDYDATNRIKTIQRPITIEGVQATSTTTYTYNDAASTTTVVDGEGRRIQYHYNPNKNVDEIVENPLDAANKAVTTFGYNDKNELVEYRDANANKNGTASYIYKYDDKGNVIEVQLPEGQKSEFKYDNKNNLVSETDYNGNDSSYLYDSFNNQLESIDAIRQATASRYETEGNVKYTTKSIAANDNLVVNQSFEYGTSFPTSWSSSTEPGRTAAFAWSTTALTGGRSVSITNPTGWALVSSNIVPYEAGQAYTASGYVKTTNATGNALIKIEYLSSTGVWLGQRVSYSLKGTHDWTRLQAVTDTIPQGTAQLRISVSMEAGTGTAIFDNIQLEKGTVASAYNYLENEGFERFNAGTGIPDRWTTSGNLNANDRVYQKTGSLDDNVYNGSYAFKMTGEAGKNKFIRQNIQMSGKAGDKFTLSAWSKQVGANPNGGQYNIQVAINHTDGTQDWGNANSFDKTAEGWQHVAAEIRAQKDFSSIEVYLCYYNQTGTAYFDATRLEAGSSITNYGYDARKNYTTSIRDGIGNTVAFGYDAAGNRTTVVDGKQKTTSYTYDKRNLLTRVTDAKNNITNYGYDNAGNRTTVTDARNKITTYEYNQFNLVSRISNPLNQQTRLEYDKNGNNTKLVYPKGDIISSSYNALNRLDKIFYNGVQRFAYTYDANGSVTAVTDSQTGKNLSYTYDKNGRLTKQQGANNTIDFEYDQNSNLTTMVQKAGATTVTTGYGYNQLNQIVRLTKNGTNLGRFIYNEEGNINTVNRQNSTSTLMQYDELSRLKTLANYNANGGIIDSYSYTYDANGNRTRVNTNTGTINYQYDDINQLTQETLINGATISYEYDAVGNRTKKTVNNGTITTTNYTYNNGNELITVNGQAYTYDANGNLTSNGVRSYIYDIDNRLKEVRNNQGQTIATYTYDHEGRRNSMTVSGTTTHFHYSGDKVVYETDNSNSIIAEYTYDPNGNPATMTRAGVTYYYHVNGHGDVTALTDAAGTIVARYDYDAYGNILSQTGAMAALNPYRYAGYRYDEATELYYLMARYYDAGVGRFITRDAFHGFVNEPLSLNQYNYAHSNPVMFVDPSGHFSVKIPAKGLGTAIDIALALIPAFQTTMLLWKAKQLKAQGVAVIVTAVSGLIKKYGIQLATTTITSAVNTILTVVGSSIGQVIANQLDRLDGNRDGYVSVKANIAFKKFW